MKISKKQGQHVKFIKALADETRFTVFQMLFESPLHVYEIIKKLKIEPTLLSHHLSILKSAGIVISKREGKSFIYHLNPEVKIRGKQKGIQHNGLKFVMDI